MSAEANKHDPLCSCEWCTREFQRQEHRRYARVVYDPPMPPYHFQKSDFGG